MDSLPSSGPWGFILDAPAHDLSQRLISALSSLDSQLLVARQILARLRTEQDDAESVKMLLNLLSSHVPSHPSLIEELIGLLSICSNHHLLYIDCVSKFVETSQEAAIVIQRYREVVAADRRLLVPVIGSLGDFPLSDAQKRQVFQMTLEALAIVEEEDIPAVVRTLLASITKDTSKTIISAIRSTTADVAVQKNASLVLEIVLNALRLHPHAARHLLLQISSSSAPLSKLDILLLIGLMDRAQSKPHVERALIASLRSGALTLDVLRSTLLDQDLILPMLPSVLSLLRCLLHAAASGDSSQILEWTMQLYALFFATYERYSTEALSSLLSAFVSTDGAPSGLPKQALTAARVLLALVVTQPAALIPYTHLFEEVLYDSAPSLHVQLLHPLCHLLALLSSFKDGGAQSSLLIFVNKALFAGARLQQRAGLVLASHLLHRGALSAPTAGQLLESVMRVIPATESHPVALLHLFDIVLYNISSIPQKVRITLFTAHIQPLLVKARILRCAEELLCLADSPYHGEAMNRVVDGKKEPAHWTAVHLAEQSKRTLGSNAAHSHPLYYSLLLQATCVLYMSLKPQEAVARLTQLLVLPIEVGSLCEKLCKECLDVGVEPISDEVDEEAAWASYHSYSLLLTLMALLHERGAQVTPSSALQALGYRSTLHRCLSVLSKRWQASANSALSAHAHIFNNLPSFGDSLLPTTLLYSLHAVLESLAHDIHTTNTAADLAAMLALRMRATLLDVTAAPAATVPTSTQREWSFTLASSATAMSRPFLQDLLTHLTHLRLLERVSKRVPRCAELRRSISKAMGTSEESKLRHLYANSLRLLANELYIILIALDASHPSSVQQSQTISALANHLEASVDARQHVYDTCVSLLTAVEDQVLALLLLQILVSLTRGLRKARDVGALFHAMLSRVFSSCDSGTLVDVLPLTLGLPTGAFVKHPLRLRKGMPPHEFAASVLRQTVLMRDAPLAVSLSEVAGAAVALLEAGLPHHPRLRSLDDVTLPPTVLALFEVASALIDCAAPSIDSTSRVSPYASLSDALRALGRAIRVFLAAVQAQRATASMTAYVSAAIASVLPVAQRQLQECVRWRASFPQGIAEERHLSLDLLSTPFAAANTCVRLARLACKSLKNPAKGRAPSSVPRAIQRTEAFFGFLESATRTHHIPIAATDDEFSVPSVRTDEPSDTSGSARRAQQWQAEVRGEEESGRNESSDTRDVLEEEEDEIEDGRFRLVTRKRKASVLPPVVAAAALLARPHSASEQNDEEEEEEDEEDEEEEEEEAYTIVVKPKPRNVQR